MEEMNRNDNPGNELEKASAPIETVADTAPSETEAPTPEKKTNNAVKFIIPAAVLTVLVAILVGVAAAAGMFGGNENKKVADAMLATFAQSREAIGDVWELDAYKGMFDNKQMSIDADFMVAGMAGLEMQYDRDDKVNGLYIDVSYFGSSLLNAVLYMDEEELSLSVPYYMDYVFYVDRTSLKEDIQKYVDEGTLDEETANALIALNEGSQEIGSAGNGVNQGALDILNAVKDIYNKAEVKKADGKTLEVNGGNQRCKGYVTIITGEQIAEILLAYKEVYEENEDFQNYLDEIIMLEEGFSSVEELKEYMDLAEGLQQMAEEASESEEEIALYFYLYDGVIAQVYAEADEDNYLEWNVKGGKFPLENTEIIFSVDGDEDTLVRNGSFESDVYKAEYLFDLMDEELNIEVEYDKNKGDFSIDIYDDYNDFIINGSIDKSIPGSELVIEIESIEMDGQKLLSGDVTISNECGEIEKPEGERLEVLKMTEDEWYAVEEEILSNM